MRFCEHENEDGLVWMRSENFSYFALTRVYFDREHPNNQWRGMRWGAFHNIYACHM